MDPVDIQFWRLGFNILAFVFGAGGSLYAWYATRSQARQDDIDELAERVQQVEADLKHAPGQQQIERIHRDIAELNGNIRELSGGLAGLRNGVDIIHQHLLAERKG